MREYAAQCLRRADAADTPEQKALLIGMAQAWLALAEQSERVSRVLERGQGHDSLTDDPAAPRSGT